MADIRSQPTATETERVIAGIWREVLELPDVGVTDNFFDLGGHSVLLHMVGDLIAERLGQRPPVVELFQYPTVRAIARRLDDDGAGTGADPARPAARNGGRLGQLRARRERRRAG